MPMRSGEDCGRPMADERKVISVVGILKNWCEHHKSKRKAKSHLFNEDGQNSIFLLIGMKKIPVLNHMKSIKITLPHSCWNDPEDICLFVPDLDKTKPDDDATIHHYRILLQNHNATVREIITVNQLRTEYQTFESRRRLVGSYSVFLCDGRISKMMPTMLGKFFIQKRKMPINVDMRHPFLQNRINMAVSKTSLTITGHGSSCACQVGNFNQTVDTVAKNVIIAMKEIEKVVPGGRANVTSLHLKTPRSLAIPLYVSLESANNVKLQNPQKKEKPVIDELTTDDVTSVMVYPSGRVIDFPSQELDEEDEVIEKNVLRATRLKSRTPFVKNQPLKNKSITKCKVRMEKKKISRSAKLSLKSKRVYNLMQKYQEKSPSAKLLSVKKKDTVIDETPGPKEELSPKREKLANYSKRSLRKKMKRGMQEEMRSLKRPKEDLPQSNERKGLLKKGGRVHKSKSPSGKRSTKTKGKKDLFAVVRNPSLMGKHM